MHSCINFSARRSLSIWWLELEVTPVTIDGLTVGNIEFSHKSYNPVAVVLDKLLDKPIIELCIVLTYFYKFELSPVFSGPQPFTELLYIRTVQI